MGMKQQLYTTEELTAARAAQRRAAVAMAVVGAVGLAACVVLCFLATRQNQEITRPLTIGASILSGWIVIFLSHSSFDGARAHARHAELMLTGPRETFSGAFSIQEGAFRVRRGVSIRRVRLRRGFHDIALTVSAEKAPLLPETFTGTVETVYDTIVSFEEGPVPEAESDFGEASA